jgi:hypothetical protein
MSESVRTPLDLFEEYGTPVYPGHPISLACYALVSARTIADVLVPGGPGGSSVVSSKAVTGAQDALQATGAMLARLQRGESLDAAVKWSNEWWGRCIRSHRPAFDKRLEPGLEQSARMEPLFRALVAAARARAAEVAVARMAEAPAERPAGAEAESHAEAQVEPGAPPASA